MSLDDTGSPYDFDHAMKIERSLPLQKEGVRESMNKPRDADWASLVPPLAGLEPNNLTPKFRAGSYTLNGWLTGSGLVPAISPIAPGTVIANGPPPENPVYRAESEIPQASMTPVLCDGSNVMTFPRANDDPPYDLVNGYNLALSQISMSIVAFPRHGRRPISFPPQWPRHLPLPGAIHMAFYDGHQELVVLDNLHR